MIAGKVLYENLARLGNVMISMFRHLDRTLSAHQQSYSFLKATFCFQEKTYKGIRTFQTIYILSVTLPTQGCIDSPPLGPYRKSRIHQRNTQTQAASRPDNTPFSMASVGPTSTQQHFADFAASPWIFPVRAVVQNANPT